MKPLAVVALQIGAAALVLLPAAAAQEAAPAPAAAPAGAHGQVERSPVYVLGPDDVIAINVLDVQEVSSGSVRIDPSGYVSLPLVGRVRAGGLTVEALEQELAVRLKTYVHEPVVAISLVEFRSQPVSIIGAVSQPGVHQLEGRKTLIEILAKAGGLKPEAGNVIKITRQAERGPIPLSTAVMDASGQFSVAEVSLTGIIQATRPEDNILVMPNDIISVPRAILVYVIGEVRRPGGFVLQERASISTLRALAMAEGFTGVAAPQRSTVIRHSPQGERIEIAANLKDILAGKKPDLELLPDDILFVPNSGAKSVLGRTLQTAISAVTSATIYRF